MSTPEHIRNMYLQNNRKNSRHDISYEVDFEIRDTLNTTNIEELTFLKGSVTNVSEGGICIKTSHDLQKSQVVKLGIPLAGLDIKVNVLAEVRWTQHMGHEGNLIGMQFFI